MINFSVQEVDFAKNNGLVPVVVQDAQTKSVLMLGYMNAAALDKTVAERRLTFYSRSKQRMWNKGETCHKGTDTCFGTANEGAFVEYLEQVIQQRRDDPSAESYTSSLFRKGINKVAQKVGEEAVELVIEAKDDNEELFLNEAADLLFHYLVLLAAKGYAWADVLEVLRGRHR